MNIIIRNTVSQPIYEQIVQQIRQQILDGTLAAGEALPSIRALARDLRVSVITTKRAYDELEAQGFLHTVAGKGCFVAQADLEAIRARRLEEMDQHLSQALELARSCQLNRQQLSQILRKLEESL